MQCRDESRPQYFSVEMGRVVVLDVDRLPAGLSVVLNDQSRPKWDDTEKAAFFFGN